MPTNKTTLTKQVRSLQEKLWEKQSALIKLEKEERAKNINKIIGNCYRFKFDARNDPEYSGYVKVLGVDEKNDLYGMFLYPYGETPNMLDLERKIHDEYMLPKDKISQKSFNKLIEEFKNNLSKQLSF